jgi:gluconokinase
MILVLMGVTGTGKTTVGHLLAAKTGWLFAEGDDFHSKENVAKMQAGIPLTDDDRAPWLASLHLQIVAWQQRGVNAILTCSALKQKYRDTLSAGLPAGALKFVILVAPKEVIAARLAQRHGHFMNPALLDSQLEILEDPKDALHVSVERSPEDAVEQIVRNVEPVGVAGA